MMFRYGVFVIMSFGFIAISSVSADGLIPCGGTNESACQACHFIELGQRLLTWFVGISASIIALMFAWGGMKMVMSGGEMSEISSGRHMMTNSVIGFVILLASWLIVDTFLKMFLTDANYGVWSKVQCVTQPKYTTTSTAAGSVTTTTTLTGEKLSDADARELLSSNGVGVNKTQEQGTSLEGINAATINDAIELKRDCNCTVIITGGTEGTGGHTVGTMSHSTGYKYDIRLNDALNTYITTNYQNIGTRSDGAVQYKNTADGSIYALEGDHWDVKVVSS